MTSDPLNLVFRSILYSSGRDIIQSHTNACISGDGQLPSRKCFQWCIHREASNDYIDRNLELLSEDGWKKCKRRVGIRDIWDSGAGHGELCKRSGGLSDANRKRGMAIYVLFKCSLSFGSD